MTVETNPYSEYRKIVAELPGGQRVAYTKPGEAEAIQSEVLDLRERLDTMAYNTQVIARNVALFIAYLEERILQTHT